MPGSTNIVCQADEVEGFRSELRDPYGEIRGYVANHGILHA